MSANWSPTGLKRPRTMKCWHYELQYDTLGGAAVRTRFEPCWERANESKFGHAPPPQLRERSSAALLRNDFFLLTKQPETRNTMRLQATWCIEHFLPWWWIPGSETRGMRIGRSAEKQLYSPARENIQMCAGRAADPCPGARARISFLKTTPNCTQASFENIFQPNRELSRSSAPDRVRSESWLSRPHLGARSESGFGP